VISHERFHARLAAGLAQGFPYSSPLKAGFIQVWRHMDVIFLTWEEYALQDAQKVRFERREFASADEALDWLETQGIDAARFGP
jgi:hypothetical protein